jgi:hypothetical protein
MSMELALVGDLLMVSEGDLDARERPPEVAIATEKMLAAYGAGTISKVELVDWMCLRVRVAEALGGEATA